MPTYTFDIQGGDEADGFKGTIAVTAPTAGEAHDLAFYKALKMTGIVNGTVESVTVTLREMLTPTSRSVAGHTGGKVR